MFGLSSILQPTVDPELQLIAAFINAAANGDLKAVQHFIIHVGVPANAHTGDSFQAIHWASHHGHLPIVQYLVEQCQVDVTASTVCMFGIGPHHTALHIASQSGHLAIVKYLIQTCRVDATTKDNRGETALHLAGQEGHLDTVQYLIESCHVSVGAKDNNGQTALHFASKDGHLNVVRYFIRYCKVDVGTKDEAGRNALHFACQGGHMDIVKYLVEECEIDETSGDDLGYTPLHLASRQGNLEIVRYFVQDCYVDVRTTKAKSGYTVLHGASEKGHLHIVRYFIQHCHVNATTTRRNDGWNALHAASHNGHLEIVRYFIEDCKLDAATLDNDEWSVLHAASAKGHLDVVKYLVEVCDVEISKTTNLGKSARQLAVDHYETKVVEYLSKVETEMQQISATHYSDVITKKKSALDIALDRKRMESHLNEPTADPIALSLEYLQLCTDNFHSEVLGEGAFGKVYLGVDKDLGIRMAVKRINLQIPDQNALDAITLSFKREIAVLKRFRHPNIVAMYGYNVLANQTNQLLVYEYLSNGSLDMFLTDEQGRTRLPSNVRLSIMFQLARSVHFLHTGGCDNLAIFHRDIKSGNICLARDYTAKLIDCGLAKFVPDNISIGLQGSVTPTMLKSSGSCVFGTAGYICPVYTRGQSPYTAACDVFSVGVVLTELLVGSLQGRQSSRFGRSIGDFFGRYIRNDDEEPVEDGWKIMKQDADVLAQWNEDILERLCIIIVECMAASPKRRMSTFELVQNLSEISSKDDTIIGDVGSESVEPDSIDVHQLTINEVKDAGSKSDGKGNTNGASALCVLCNRLTFGNVSCVDGHQTCIQCIEEEIRSHLGQSGDSFCCRCGSRIHDAELYGKISISTFTSYSHARYIRKDLNEQFDTIKSQLNAIFTMTEQNHGFAMTILSGIESSVQRVLGGLAYLASNSVKECPTLVWLVPSERIQGKSVQALKQWAKNLTHKSFDLYFVCQHSFEVVDSNMTIKVPRSWLVQAAPVLYLTMLVLKAALTMDGLPALPFPFPNLSRVEQISMYQHFLADFLDDSTMDLLKTFESAYAKRSDISYSQSSQLQTLTGAAYEGIVAKATKMKRFMLWRQHMDPVPNKQGSIIWVQKEYSGKYLNNGTVPA